MEVDHFLSRWKTPMAGDKENGTNNGPFTMWYPDGKVKMRGQYKKGSKNGKSTIFHPNGENGESSGTKKAERSEYGKHGTKTENLSRK